MNYALQVNLDNSNLLLLKGFLACIMFVLAQDISIDKLKEVITNPKNLVVGLISQLFLLPFVTFCFLSFYHLEPQIALGLVIIAACPGGNFSNLFSFMAGGNLALSLTMTIFSTTLCMFFTPFNIFFWGNMLGTSREALESVNVGADEVLTTVVFIMGIPLIAGLISQKYFPEFSKKSVSVLKKASVAMVLIFFSGAFIKNKEQFLYYTKDLLPVVAIHSGLMIFVGALVGKITKFKDRDNRTLVIELVVQNGGLGLGIILSFFPELVGTAVVVALWAVWNIVNGFVLIVYWNIRDKLRLGKMEARELVT